MKELCKNIAIVFLSCSAVFLASRVEALTKFTHYLLEEDTVALVDESAVLLDTTSALVPWSMVAVNGETQVSASQTGTAFSLASQILKEALGNLGTAYSVEEAVYFSALETGPSLYFQWLGEIPVALWEEWSGELVNLPGETAMEGILLSGTGEGISFFYEAGGFYYECPVNVLEASRLETVVAQIEGVSRRFAFQAGMDGLWPLTLLCGEGDWPLSYLVSNSYDEGHKALLEVLGFQALNNSQYSTHDGMAIRSGTDTLRLSYDGLISYQREEQSRYFLSHGGVEISLLEQVEGCRNFATGMMQTMETVADLTLSLVEEREETLVIGFSACLGGIPLSYGEGTTVVEFVVEGDEIVEFTLQYRHYKATEQRVPVLPGEIALVIHENLGLAGEDLFLSYFDLGEELLVATWVS